MTSTAAVRKKKKVTVGAGSTAEGGNDDGPKGACDVPRGPGGAPG